ncbi:MAG TPA: ABC transporter substrate-binding protein [Chloroflexota bacterium]|nr:ABC transporter substrate-binding protein [Chloroflexota bacterium]
MRRRIARLLAAATLLAPLGCTSAAAPPTAAPKVPASAAAPAGAASDQAAGPPARVPLNLPYAGRGVAGLAHYLALEDGLYAKRGLEVTSPNIGNPPTLVAAILSGEAPIASAALEPVITAAASGAEVVMIASNLNGIAMSVIAQPSIRTSQELRGKRLGVTAYSSPTHTGAVLYLRSLGLDPQRDVAVTPIGGMPEIRGALESGALDAATITPPLSYALVRAGFTELADLSKGELKYQQGSIATTRGYLRQQPDIVRRVLDAYTEAYRVILTDKAAAQRVLAKWVEVTEPADLDKTYELAVRGFGGGPVVEPDAVQTTIDLLAESTPAVRGLRAEQIIDNRLANELAAQYGFPTR